MGNTGLDCGVLQPARRQTGFDIGLVRDFIQVGLPEPGTRHRAYLSHVLAPRDDVQVNSCESANTTETESATKCINCCCV